QLYFDLWIRSQSISVVLLLSDGLRVFRAPSVYLIFPLQLNQVEVLVSLGYAIALFSAKIPLFEWQISDIVTSFPSPYKVHTRPSPWIASIGDSLNQGLYVSLGQVYVSKYGDNCRAEDVTVIVKRSRIDETSEWVSINIDKSISWLSERSWIEIMLSLIYIWWFTIWYKRPIWEAVVLAIFFTVMAGIFYFVLAQILRHLLPTVVPFESAGILDCYHGIVTFNAKLLKVHYQSLIFLFIGILAELGAFGMMLRQIIRAVIERKRL
ncbi:MAG TPA: hypothetical protein VK249_08305, partial [Anaerolineales bacterium]|nr:hypothetical protein [Anaerolineales bacterium]